MKRAIVSVINDLSTDQRVDKVCKTLQKAGYEVLLLGRRKKDSRNLEERSYKTHRMNLLFEKEAIFYAEFNIRLFFFLLFNKSDLLISNDLDTLLPNFLISKIKRIPLVYDSHEYFTEVPELINNNFARNVWLKIEEFIFPKLKYVFTVNQSIAEIYQNKYKVEVKVVRNIPLKKEKLEIKSRKELGLDENKKILILQGAGINIDRGVEELLEAMQYLDNIMLLIIGDGDVIGKLKKMAEKPEIESKVRFINRIPYQQLIHYTANADLGISIDKDSNLNYRYSLPNKLFDYINAGIPVLVSDLPEVKKIVKTYNIGEVINSHKPTDIAEKIKQMLDNKDLLRMYKENTQKASEDLCWENEEKELLKVYKAFIY